MPGCTTRPSHWRVGRPAIRAPWRGRRATSGATNPPFAVEAGVAALRWIAAGHGYEITGLDVLSACSSAMDAARNAGAVDETKGRIRNLLAGPKSPSQEFIAAALGRTLDPS
jgi:hypothetical protein